MRLRFVAVAATCLITPTAVQAAPLNTWGERVAPGSFAFTPYLYAGQTFGLESLTYLEYGVADSFEIAGAIDATVAPGQSFDAIELMPRLFFDAKNALSLRIRWSPATSGDVILGPEFHGVYEMDALTWTINGIWTPSVGSSGVSPGTLGAIVAPEYFFDDTTSLYVELSPTYDLSATSGSLLDRLSFEALPGISFAVGDVNSFSLGVGIPVLNFSTEAIYFGGWYSLSIGGA